MPKEQSSISNVQKKQYPMSQKALEQTKIQEDQALVTQELQKLKKEEKS